jgi:hypothetical protein
MRARALQRLAHGLEPVLQNRIGGEVQGCACGHGDAVQMKLVCKIFLHLQAFLSSHSRLGLQINLAPKALRKNQQNHVPTALWPHQALPELSPSNRQGSLAGHRYPFGDSSKNRQTLADSSSPDDWGSSTAENRFNRDFPLAIPRRLASSEFDG